MTSCTKIVLHMREDNREWQSVVETAEATDVSMSHEFLPDTAEEELVIRVVRRTQRSIEYAAYVKSIGFGKHGNSNL